MTSEKYLEAKVTTASQPELHLMLLDGAMRHAKVAQEAAGDPEQFSRYSVAMDKLLDILDALVQGAAGGKHEISKSLEDQYVFLFRQTVEAHAQDDRQKLATAVELLAYHRETWRQACDSLKRVDQKSPTKATIPHFDHADVSIQGGMSLEA